MIRYIADEVIDAFLADVKSQSVLRDIDGGLKVVYTPLNGTGRMCVTRLLDMIGVKDVTIVPEQEFPDGNFTTCPYPVSYTQRPKTLYHLVDWEQSGTVFGVKKQ